MHTDGATPAPQEPNRQRLIQRVLYITLGLNLLVFAVKLILSYLTGSLSLFADALHSVTDSANNILGLVAMRLAKPEPDWDHPYGHAKFEAVGALGIAAFLGVAFLEIVQQAIARVVAPDPESTLTVDDLSLKLMIGVLGVNIFVAVYERMRGRALNSHLLLADARHTFSDIWISLAVLLGLWGVQLGFPWLDTILALPVAVLVLWSAWLVLRENIPFLTDRVAIAPKAIHAVAMRVPGVLNCHAITSRGMVGQMVFIEMHVVVQPPDVESAHRITEQVEKALREQFGAVQTTIHLEPYEYIEPFDPQAQRSSDESA